MTGYGEGGAAHRSSTMKAQPGSLHHFSDEETIQLATFINARFAEEPLLANLLPVDGSNPDAFFEAWRDGRLLIALVDAACEGVVDIAFLRRRARKPLGVTSRHLTIQHFAVLNDALEGCKKIEGLKLGFVGAEDFVQGNRPVILGVGWQLVRLAILRNANVAECPALAELFTPEEAENKCGHAGQEELVLSRWFNRYLKAVGSDRELGSFGAELADGVAWCSLLNAIDPAACPPPDEFDPEGNASNAISAAKKMGVKGVFLTDEELIDSDRKLNVMFCAQIMSAFPELPSHLKGHDDPEKRARVLSNKRRTESISSSSHTSDSATVTTTQSEVPFLSAAVNDPSPSETPTVGENCIQLDREVEREHQQACWFGRFFGIFGCVSRD